MEGHEGPRYREHWTTRLHNWQLEGEVCASWFLYAAVSLVLRVLGRVEPAIWWLLAVVRWLNYLRKSWRSAELLPGNSLQGIILSHFCYVGSSSRRVFVVQQQSAYLRNYEAVDFAENRGQTKTPARTNPLWSGLTSGKHSKKLWKVGTDRCWSGYLWYGKANLDAWTETL